MTESCMPRHVAIILDGNGRWAKMRFLPRFAGHKIGVDAVRRIVKYSAKQGIEVLTLFVFSSENWRRPVTEVELLLRLFLTTLNKEAKILHKRNVRLQIIGDRSAFPLELQQCMADAENLTKNNDGIRLVFAANYGGRWDIAQAASKLASAVEQGLISSNDINSELFSQYLCLADLPEPDLFIRTGGEQRISNFLLWQLAYTELYFTDTLWPDFDEQQFQLALDAFASRERRFGRTSEQLTSS